jgi:hypothetical protein
MNSKQRRGLRVYKHEVTLDIHSGERYLEFERRVDTTKIWLKESTKPNGWIVFRTGYNFRTFKFRDAATATMFVLKFA